jgi:hypothetical protein
MIQMDAHSLKEQQKQQKAKKKNNNKENKSFLHKQPVRK